MPTSGLTLVPDPTSPHGPILKLNKRGGGNKKRNRGGRGKKLVVEGELVHKPPKIVNKMNPPESCHKHGKKDRVEI